MDRSLRDAERSGDGVALLRERIRAGQLTQAHVELAASLGHAAARKLCPEVELVDWSGFEPMEWSGQERIKTAIGEATRLTRDTIPAQVAADWAESVLPLWEGAHSDDTGPRDAIAVARAWVACPCRDHRVAAEVAWTPTQAVRATYSVAEVAVYSAAVGAAGVASYPVNGSEGFAALALLAAGTADAAAAAVFQATRSSNDRHVARAAAEAAREREREWQRLRLAACVLGEVEEAARD